jgi:hypothetical protein
MVRVRLPVEASGGSSVAFQVPPTGGLTVQLPLELK